MRQTSGNLRRQRGFSSIYLVIMLAALCGVVSMGVDIGRVQLARGELQTAADAAARSAAQGLSISASQARNDAQATAAANTCDGVAVAIDKNVDVELGVWDSSNRTFTPLSGWLQNLANAVRVTARRTTAANNPIPLAFGAAVGRGTCDISAVSIARISRRYGIIGLNSITMRNGAETDSYNSAIFGYIDFWFPDKGNLASNGNITLQNDVIVRGDAHPGASGAITISGAADVTGDTDDMSYTIDADAIVAAPYGPLVNDNANIPSGYRPGTDFLLDNATTTMPAGVYYFRNFTMRNAAVLNVTGKATVYVHGTFLIDHSARTSTHRPMNMRINVMNTGTVTIRGSNGICADVYAPDRDITLGGDRHLYGGVFGKTVVMENEAELHYDESLAADITLVQ